MYAFLRLTGHFITAVIITFVLASIFHSQFVLGALVDVGAEIDFATRIASTIDDMVGLALGYGTIICVALLLGFSIMAGVKKLVKSQNLWVYPFAGALAMLTTHIAMHPIFGVTLIAGARGTDGILAQCFSGLVGGCVFLYLRRAEQ